MQWKALLIVGLMLTAGCLGGSDDDDSSQAQTIDAKTSDGSAVETNETGNATYLQNSDYSKAHIHDYWGEASERVIMDEVLEVWTCLGAGWDEGEAASGCVFFSLPNGSFVPEGTGQLIVEVDATGSLRNGQMELEYKAANTAEYVETDPQGAQAEWLIELTPQMADLPHSKSTRWAFNLEGSGHGAVLEGEVNVKITAVKVFEIAEWPEHPDFWNNGTRNQIGLGNLNATFDQLGLGFSMRMGDLYDSEADREPVTFPEGTIVPPETSVLLIKFWYDRSNHAKNNLNGDIDLYVKEGSTSTWYRSLEWGNQLETEEADKLYYVEVDGSNWDSPYAEQSQWSFQIRAPSGLNDGTVCEGCAIGLADIGAGNATIDVTAYRDVPGWLDAEI